MFGLFGDGAAKYYALSQSLGQSYKICPNCNGNGFFKRYKPTVFNYNTKPPRPEIESIVCSLCDGDGRVKK